VVNDATVKAVSAQLEDITDEQVRAVITAWKSVNEGDPVGTIVADENGTVAYRIDVDGVHLWQVVTATGEQWRDMSPTLKGPWRTVRSGEGVTTTEGLTDGE
jgi:N-glycosylase/DNA lyase